jgi:hypothetical protein
MNAAPITDPVEELVHDHADINRKVLGVVPDLADQVHAMALAHDAICGGLARMYHLAAANADLTVILAVFARFETAYASHAETEAELLRRLSDRLDSAQRAQLAELVRGL